MTQLASPAAKRIMSHRKNVYEKVALPLPQFGQSSDAPDFHLFSKELNCFKWICNLFYIQNILKIIGIMKALYLNLL